MLPSQLNPFCILVDSSTVICLDKSICHFWGIRSVLSLLFYFLWKILLANNVDFVQTPHDVASDPGLHCLPLTVFMGFPGKNGLMKLCNDVTASETKQTNFRSVGLFTTE